MAYENLKDALVGRRWQVRRCREHGFAVRLGQKRAPLRNVGLHRTDRHCKNTKGQLSKTCSDSLRAQRDFTSDRSNSSFVKGSLPIERLSNRAR